jgi:hypothetical protein
MTIPPAVRTGALVGVALGGLPSFLNVAVHWASVFGPRLWVIPGTEFFTVVPLGALLLLPLSLCAALLPRIRAAAGPTALAAVVVLGLSLGSLELGWWIRNLGLARLARQSAPLVAAIHQWRRETGAPPSSLDLLPLDLRRTLPDFQYVVGPEAERSYHGNPWVLVLDTSTGLINWDLFLYYPLQNYPEVGHGGWLERIDDWAYVHE